MILGNAALSGAAMILMDHKLRSDAEQIAFRAVPINLGGNPFFNKKFVENMLFE